MQVISFSQLQINTIVTITNAAFKVNALDINNLAAQVLTAAITFSTHAATEMDPTQP